MKTLKFALGYAIVLLLVLQSCSKGDSNGGNDKEDSGIQIGELTYEKSSKDEAVPVLKLGMEEIRGIIKENHQLAKEEKVYKFENAWIESFKQENGTDYFLAASGESRSITDPADVRCYTLYTLLKCENGNLLFEPPGGGDQHSCEGHRCSQCKLKQNDDGYYCDCLMPVDPTGYCDHSVISGGGGAGGE